MKEPLMHVFVPRYISVSRVVVPFHQFWVR